jgi:stress response protein YsnF
MPERTPPPLPPGEVAIPVAEERLRVSKREVETGQVHVALSTEIEQVVARETLKGHRVEVERVPVGRVLAEGEAPPRTREEGNTLVIPVVEETAVVVKRLVVREEVRLRFLPTEAAFEQEVALRRQRATVERVAPGEREPRQPAAPSPHPAPEGPST